ncbi:MAG: BspA family leucine-rich repeat surface protein [Prevotellaceae bacterium]|nr:BspA family leucine-rich repeat surface protein [Candidatus Minthosoma equi]
MKNTMKTLLALMAGVMTFSACSNEDVLTNENTNPEAKPILTFNASTESDGATRATIDVLAIKWQAGDAILMMDGTNSSKYNLDAGCEGTTSGTFTRDGGSTAVSGENIYALYPYSEGSLQHTANLEDAQAAAEGIDGVLNNLEQWKDDIDETKTYASNLLEDELNDKKSSMNVEGISAENQAIIIAYLLGENIGVPAPVLSGSSITNVTLPAFQTVAAGQTVDPKAVLMVAKADGEDLAFKNVCSYVKVTPTVACKKIEVRAMGAYLAGTFTVADVTAPEASSISGGTSVVTLQAQSGELEAGTYYIAVLPGTKSNGIEVRFYTSAETFNYNIRSTSFEFVRSKVHSGGNNSGALGTTWSKNTSYNRWSDANYINAKTVTISTGVSGTMPAGAKALNNDNTLWSRKDAEYNYYIETSASKIVTTNMREAFCYLKNVESYTGLDKLDVSDVSTFDGCFQENRNALASLDLSSWQINPAANTKQMFKNCMSLSSLTINNSFHYGYNVIDRIGQELPDGQYCIIKGVTDEAVKNDLNRPGSSYNATYTKFKFEGE